MVGEKLNSGARSVICAGLNEEQVMTKDIQPAGACPTCSKPPQKPHSPFCSRRCAEIDLGCWLNGEYAVPAVEARDDSDVDALLEKMEKDAGLN